MNKKIFEKISETKTKLIISELDRELERIEERRKEIIEQKIKFYNLEFEEQCLRMLIAGETVYIPGNDDSLENMIVFLDDKTEDDIDYKFVKIPLCYTYIKIWEEEKCIGFLLDETINQTKEIFEENKIEFEREKMVNLIKYYLEYETDHDKCECSCGEISSDDHGYELDLEYMTASALHNCVRCVCIARLRSKNEQDKSDSENESENDSEISLESDSENASENDSDSEGEK